MKFFTKKADLPPGKAERVPPGQYLTEKWPVLHYGPVPTFNPKTWDLRVFGKVKNELRWTWDELQALDKEINTQVTADMHCVTTWSRLDQKWEGVSFAKIVELAQPTDEKPRGVRLTLSTRRSHNVTKSPTKAQKSQKQE